MQFWGRGSRGSTTTILTYLPDIIPNQISCRTYFKSGITCKVSFRFEFLSIEQILSYSLNINALQSLGHVRQKVRVKLKDCIVIAIFKLLRVQKISNN